MDEWPQTLDILYIAGTRFSWEFAITGLGSITGLASTLEIEAIGTITGTVLDADLGVIAFDPDGLPALLVAAPASYDYTLTLDPGGGQERVVLEGEVIIRARRVA